MHDTILIPHRCPGKQLLRIPGTPWLESSEDCLTLNIFRWRGTFANARLPVLVYIHGGAFNRGFAAMHDTASMLANSEEPFIALSFNYRIGALGFLNSKVTEKQGLLNLGLHDQKLVLEWVAKNVENFGKSFCSSRYNGKNLIQTRWQPRSSAHQR